MPTPMSVQPQFSDMNAMPPMPVNAMPTQNMNAQFANMPFAPNPYYAAYNMPQIPFSMPYWNNMFAQSMPYQSNVLNDSVTNPTLQPTISEIKDDSKLPKSKDVGGMKSRKKTNKAGPKEAWVPKST